MKQFLFIALCFTLSTNALTSAFASWKVQVVRSASGSKILSVQESHALVPRSGRVLIQSLPAFLDETRPPAKYIYEEYLMNDASVPDQWKTGARVRLKRVLQLQDPDVRTLVNQGPLENRINLTIVGDGYTQSEREKFFEDATRTVKSLFTGSTFTSYLPLFNVHAVFVASNESGIGDGSPKDTALRLYRDPPGSKRAIMPGDEAAAEKAIARAPATDFPILLANDNFYGGLGGRFAISTSSVRSGMIVLRHELGHNFGNVGEEYDGGYVYSGANHSGSSNVPWVHWVDGTVNEAMNLGGDYMWKNLKEGAQKMGFTFPGQGPWLFTAEISSVGWETPDDVFTTIDGKRIPLHGEFNNDRDGYEVGPLQNFPAGDHEIKFTENVHDGDNVLAYARLYAMPASFDFANHVGAYATYDDGNQKVGYRPTYKFCLMRDMWTPHFCPVDQENMWVRFLSRVSLIDKVTVGQQSGQNGKKVILNAVKLPLTISWFKIENGNPIELTPFHNQTAWTAEPNLKGDFLVKVRFSDTRGAQIHRSVRG